MNQLSDVGTPWPPSSDAPPPYPGEPTELATLAGSVSLAPRVWIPASAEDAFYRLNNLGVQLQALFGPVGGFDPDEDDIDELAPPARRRIAGHALLGEWVDAFYDACHSLGGRLRVRRPGMEGRLATRGRPALLAVRAEWLDAWSDDAVLARLRATGSVGLEPAPLIVHAEDAPAPAGTHDTVARLLGGPREVHVVADGSISRLASAERRAGARGQG